MSTYLKRATPFHMEKYKECNQSQISKKIMMNEMYQTSGTTT